MIPTIIFDWGHVISSEDYSYSKDLIKNIENEFNCNLNIDIFKPLIKKLNHNQLSTKDFINKLNSTFNIKLTKEKLLELIEKTVKINLKTVDLIHKLKKNNYNLIILSNNNEPTVELIRNKYKYIIDLFNKTYFSNELNLIKPDKEIFKYVIKELDIKPKEIIFIDDKEENIKSAENLGIRSILYSSTEELIKELNKLKVNTH